MNYRVVWTIDLDAGTPREAAERALEIQRDPTSIALVFEVIRKGLHVEIDLGEHVSTCGKCGDEYPDPDGDADCPKCHDGRRP